MTARLVIQPVVVFGDGQPLQGSLRVFTNSVSITFKTGYPGGLTFYTLDGSTPTFESRLYTGAFDLRRDAVIRAIAYRADFLEAGLSAPVQIVVVPLYEFSAHTDGGGVITQTPLEGRHHLAKWVN